MNKSLLTIALGIMPLFMPGILSAKDIVFENFNKYTFGSIQDGGNSSAVDPWFAFGNTAAVSEGAYHPVVEISPRGGYGGSQCLHISAGILPETKSFFFVGGRYTFDANLAGLDLKNFKLTADVRVEVTDRDTNDKYIPPNDFYYELHLESFGSEHSTGMRSFKILGSTQYETVGGIITKGVAGRGNKTTDFIITEGLAKYQIVILITSNFIGFPFEGGNYSLDVYVDNLKLQTVEYRKRKSSRKKAESK